MKVQKQSWIVLLRLLCQHVYLLSATERKAEVCEGGSLSLSCESGYINVINANYGRTNSTTCSAEKPSDQLSNIHCFQEISLYVMSTRCNGQKSCSVPAVNSVFSDPCVGTYKYLTVTYECPPLKQSITCEYNQSVIDCEMNSLIVIHHANYGRRDLATCPHEKATTPDCYYRQTASLHSRCNGRRSCPLNASNSVFGDPCYGIFKYLEVTYSCEMIEVRAAASDEETVFAENST